MNELSVTSPEHYLTGTSAMAIPSDDTSFVDWHFVDTFLAGKASFRVAGLNFPGTSALLGNHGVRECSGTLRRHGVPLPPDRVFYAANRDRALLDLIVSNLQKARRPDHLRLEDYCVDLKVPADGSLYYLNRGNSSVYRVRFTSAPGITAQPQDQTAPVGGSATFSVTASGAQPLFYQWQRDGFDISGANAASYTVSGVQPQDDGAMFQCRVNNAYGSITSNAAQLTVSNNQAPAASILAPLNGAHFNAGNTIAFSGSGNDPENGNLPASAFSWTIIFHHDTHTHPFLGPVNNTTSGTFTIPTSGETSANVFYRIHLTVTDSAGAQDSTFVDILPNVVTLSLFSDPGGFVLTLDGQPVTAPLAVQSVVGMTRTIGAPSPQRVNKVNYDFVSWSDGGAQTHTISTPGTNTGYTAVLRKKGRR